MLRHPVSEVRAAGAGRSHLKAQGKVGSVRECSAEVAGGSVSSMELPRGGKCLLTGPSEQRKEMLTGHIGPLSIPEERQPSPALGPQAAAGLEASRLFL